MTFNLEALFFQESISLESQKNWTLCPGLGEAIQHRNTGVSPATVGPERTMTQRRVDRVESIGCQSAINYRHVLSLAIGHREGGELIRTAGHPSDSPIEACTQRSAGFTVMLERIPSHKSAVRIPRFAFQTNLPEPICLNQISIKRAKSIFIPFHHLCCSEQTSDLVLPSSSSSILSTLEAHYPFHGSLLSALVYRSASRINKIES